MIEIRELVIRVNVAQDRGETAPAELEERLAAMKAELIDACDERIEAALSRGSER